MPLSVIDSTGLASPLTGLNNPTIVGNITLSTSNGGIVFNPSTVGNQTVTSNTLSDYEIGTFTPTIVCGSGTVSYGTRQTGYYTKIGNIVNIYIDVSFSNNQASPQIVSLSSLPFTVFNNSNFFAAFSVAAWYGVVLQGTNYSVVEAYPSPNTTQLNFQCSGNAQAQGSIFCTATANSLMEMRIIGSYRATT